MDLSDAPNLCGLFVDSLSIDGASISVFDNAGRQVTVCATNPLAARLDELQFELGVGPSWEAMHTNSRVLVQDVTEPGPNVPPLFGAALKALDVRALFAFPMVLGAVVVGVVSLHRERAVLLNNHELEHAATLVGSVTASAVRLALRTAAMDADSTTTVFGPAMRREVHQATGMILVQLDVSATEAFLRLRARAFATSRSIQDVAHDVVTHVLDFRDLPNDA
jgi:ANTAR domain/GAF domain